MRYFFLLIGVAFAILSCEDNGQVTIAQEVDTQKTDTIVLRKTSGRKPQLQLTSVAKETTKNWRTYNALVKFTNEINGITFLEFKKKVTEASSLFLQQEETIPVTDMLWPKALNKPAIHARMLVVETKVKILATLSKKQLPDVPKIEQEITALQNALQDLNLQINHSFSKSVDEMLEELEKADKEANSKPPTTSVHPTGKPEIIKIQH